MREGEREKEGGEREREREREREKKAHKIFTFDHKVSPCNETGSTSSRDPEGFRRRASSTNKSLVCEREGGGMSPERTVSNEASG